MSTIKASLGILLAAEINARTTFATSTIGARPVHTSLLSLSGIGDLRDRGTPPAPYAYHVVH